MTRDLRERYGGWALVTGASSGLGRCYAEALAERGFPVVLVARRGERLEELAAELRRVRRVECVVVVLDLADVSSIDALERAVGDREIGVLVANAGFGFSGRFADLPEDAYVRMVQLNCTGTAALVRRFLPRMLRRRRGAVVVVASLAGHQPTPWFTVYGATKAFVLALAEGLWSELRGTGVDVQALCPGRTKTEFSSQAHYDRPPDGADPRAVVEEGLRKLGRGPTVVTGAGNKLVALLHRFLPRRAVLGATGTVLARELLRASPAEIRKRPWA